MNLQISSSLLGNMCGGLAIVAAAREGALQGYKGVPQCVKHTKTSMIL